MFLIRLPRTPTQAPTQSTRASELMTATLLRYPGSREMARISITPSAISGISCSKSRWTSCGRIRERMILTRLPTFRTSKIVARMRSLGWKVSPGICSLRGRIASVAPSVTVAVAPSKRLTTPDTISPICSSNSSWIASRSASRIFWMMTCLAVWAPIRPESSAVSISTPSRVPWTRPSARSMATCTSEASPYCRVRAVPSAASIAWKTISLSMFLSRWIASTMRRISSGFMGVSDGDLGELGSARSWSVSGGTTLDPEG